MPKKFEFNVNDQNHNLTHSYSCELKATRCEAFTKNGKGNRCKRKCITPFEYCPIHLELLKHLKVKDSPIAGKGLFAFDKKKDDDEIIFKANPKKKVTTKIIDYKGEQVTKNELKNRYLQYTAPYSICNHNNKKCLDSACKRGIGSFANYSPHANKRNARLSEHPKFSLRSTKNIYNNDEILLSYGRGRYKINEPGVSFTTKPYYPKNKKHK